MSTVKDKPQEVVRLNIAPVSAKTFLCLLPGVSRTLYSHDSARKRRVLTVFLFSTDTQLRRELPSESRTALSFFSCELN